MIRIRKNTAAIHRRNARRAEWRMKMAAYNPMNIYLGYQLLDILF